MDNVTARTMRTPSTGSQEYGGVGAESWVNGRQNSTGYNISTGDAARRPGLVQGRANAAIVARRVNALEQINSMNRKAWG